MESKERSLQKNYSPFDYYVAPGNMADSQVHRGFTAREYVSIREERWGLKNIFSDKAPTLPIKEGKFWPSALLGRDLTGLS